MFQSENTQPPILPHSAFKLPIHLLALLFTSPSTHRSLLYQCHCGLEARQSGAAEMFTCPPNHR